MTVVNHDSIIKTLGENFPNNYIVDEGITNDGWYVVKYASGRATAEKMVNMDSVFVKQAGGLWESPTLVTPIPTGVFKSYNELFEGSIATTNGAVLENPRVLNGKCAWYALNLVSQPNPILVTTFIKINGKWKELNT